MTAKSTTHVPTREELDQIAGPLLIEFGASWCGHCLALKPTIESLLQATPGLPFLWVEDGPGKPLGRSFQVKLWPTLVFMRDGKVLQRLVRPSADEVIAAMELLKRLV
ncbi:MAG: thioredoxin family protein [Gemmataceae bacterium]|nr:thioredoxin family protein [Gemmataceae bacterium]